MAKITTLDDVRSDSESEYDELSEGEGSFEVRLHFFLFLFSQWNFRF